MTCDKGLGLYVFGPVLHNALTVVGRGWEHIAKTGPMYQKSGAWRLRGRNMLSIRIDDDLELKSLEEAHAEELFALIEQNREYLREWLPWVDDNTSFEDSKKFIESSLGQSASGIWYNGSLVGVIGYGTVDRLNRKASIGYWLGASFQDRGLMTKACRAVVEHSFTELGMNRIEIHCAAENKRSRAIPEKLGFVQEGTIQQGQWLYYHFVDLVVYGMLASEWKDSDAEM